MAKHCIYCGSSWNIQEDHIIAQSKGGKRTVPACRACNASKGDKPLTQWLNWLKKNDPYRWRRTREYNYCRRNPMAKAVHSVRDKRK